MSKDGQCGRRLLLPVRRRLVCVTLSCLAGVYAALYISLPVALTMGLCAFLLGWAVLRLARRKSALLCFVGIFLLVGNGMAGRELAIRDLPTQAGVQIAGRVAAIEKPYRVYLQDVTADGKPAAQRKALVTLMREEAEEGTSASVSVGQLIRGTGRLFAPEEARNPGGVNRRIQAIADGYELSGYILPGWTAEGETCFSLREWFRGLRLALIERTKMVFGSRTALFQGVMLGDKAALSSEVTHAMRMTGTVHVLTVSGMHLGMIASVVSALLRRAGFRRYARLGVLGAVLGFFACLTGGAAGTVRALIMALLRELAHIRGRAYEPLTALAFSALVMTLARPLWALDASFQFSFFVVLGIILLGHGVSAGMKKSRLLRRLRRGMGVMAISLSAQIAALPMQLLFYGYVPLLALPMNLLCSMLMPLLLMGGWLCTMASVLPKWAYGAPASLLGAIGSWFETVSVEAAALRFGVLRLPAPYAASVLVFAAMMALLSSRIHFGKRRRTAVICVVFLIAVSYLPRLCPSARYVQLDVGQGDAAIFRDGRRAVLVDVGPADHYDVLRYLRHEGLFVDAVVLSHLDEDHAGALGVLLDSEVEIPCVVMAEGARGTEVSPDVRAGLDRLLALGIPAHEVRRGDMLSIGNLRMDVLAPEALRLGGNEHSLLIHAKLAGTSFLLTGDLPQESEPENVPRCDVLKVAHHGSAKATSKAFLEKAQPIWALISVGRDNRYGHPTKRVLDALKEAGCRVLRTDEAGCVTLWLGNGVRAVNRFIGQ